MTSSPPPTASPAAPATVAVATCSAVPHLDGDGDVLLGALAGAGLTASIQVWDDPGVNWEDFDAVLIRSTWDYVPRLPDFLAWVAALGGRALNPAPLIAWNTDKSYLASLADAGVAVVPTLFRAPGQEAAIPADWGEVVVKPSVSASSADTGRFAATGGALPDAGDALLAAIHAGGRTAMLQPYQRGIDTEGETALIYLGGEFSHAARKAPILRPGGGGLGDIEDMRPAAPTGAQLEVALAALAAIPVELGPHVYARADLVPGDQGPLLLELELAEPSLFFAQAPDPRAAAGRLADAVRRWLAG